MAQVESPKTKSLLKPTITVPHEWIPKINEYMKKRGYISLADMIRDLIREKIIEAEEQ